MKIHRITQGFLFLTAFAAAAALTGCMEDRLVNEDTPALPDDGTVRFNGVLSGIKSSAVQTRSSWEHLGEAEDLLSEEFDNFEESGSMLPIQVPFLIRQWKKDATGQWSHADCLYTDHSTVHGSLAPYPADIFSRYLGATKLEASYEKPDYVTNTPFASMKSITPLTWGNDPSGQSCFSAWTPVLRMYLRDSYTQNVEHVEDWVFMDADMVEENKAQFGTVKFFRWGLNGGKSSRLVDTLYIGMTDLQSRAPSLANFIGISGQVLDDPVDADVRHRDSPHMIGSTGAEAGNNPPLTYRENGASVSLRFQHLVSRIKINQITVIHSDGDVVPLNHHDEAIVEFPNLPRYARFTTGDPTKGEAPHLIVDEEEKKNDPHHSNLESYLKEIFKRPAPTAREGTKLETGWEKVWPADEYTSIVKHKGLASYWKYDMYVPPFDLSDPVLGEFVVTTVKVQDDKAQWNEDQRLQKAGVKDGTDLKGNPTPVVAGRYYGNLSAIADKLKADKVNLPGYNAEKAQWLTWLEAGEELKLNLQLADGLVTGISVTIEGWGFREGGETTSHGRSGVFSSADLNDIRENYWESNDSSTCYVPEGLADDQKRIYIYDDIEYTEYSEFSLKMWGDGYTLYGQGHIIECEEFHERSGNKNKGNVFDLFIYPEKESDDHPAGTIFWYDFDGTLQLFESWDEAIKAREEALEKKNMAGAGA